MVAEAPKQPIALATLGMWGALILVGVTLVGASVLGWEFVTASASGQVQLIEQRILLSGVGCFVGTAFGILGFALFLIQAEGAFKGTFDDGSSNRRVGLQATAPGLVVFLCATVVIYLSLRGSMTLSLHDTDDGSGAAVHQK